MFWKIILEEFPEIPGKNLVAESYFGKTLRFRLAALLVKVHRHECFPLTPGSFENNFFSEHFRSVASINPS